MSVTPIDERDRLFALPRHVERADTRSLGADLTSALHDTVGLFGALRRRAIWIVLLGALGAAAGIGVGTVMPTTWTSTARIMVDPREQQLAPVPFAPGVQTPDVVMVDSQATVMTSRNVLATALTALGPVPEPAPGPLDGLKRLAGLAPPPVGDAEALALAKLARSVTVHRVPGTYVLEVSAHASAPERARAVADAVVAAYFDEQARAERDSLGRAGQLLDTRLESLRARVVEAEAAVQAFASRNGIVGTGETGLDEQQLGLLNEEYAAARADASAARARLEAVERVARGEAGVDALPQAVASGAVQQLRASLTIALDREAALASELLPGHPRMLRAAEQVAGIRAQLSDELARAARAVRDEFRIAEDREREMARRVEEAAARTTDVDERMIELRALEREAAAARSVLDDYLQRMNALTEEAGLQLPSARVLSPADLPLRPSSLPPIVWAVLGTLAGLLLGAAVALVAEALRTPRSHPRHVAHAL